MNRRTKLTHSTTIPVHLYHILMMVTFNTQGDLFLYRSQQCNYTQISNKSMNASRKNRLSLKTLTPPVHFELPQNLHKVGKSIFNSISIQFLFYKKNT